MIGRYLKQKIESIWSDASKTQRWDDTEIAVIGAKTKAGRKRISTAVFERIASILRANPVDLRWWYKRDEEIHHDAQAYVEERRRHLTEPELAEPFHDEGMTSFDTEESASVRMLADSVSEVMPLIDKLKATISDLALRYRYSVMRERSHGNGGDLKTFGSRCLTWLVDVRVAEMNIKAAAEWLQYSKISGAFGNYTGIDPKVEEEALKTLGLKPFYGATQILPRILFSALSDALSGLVLQLNKISHDVRLGARSPFPIYQEPFGTIQKGSSAMPDKRNPIRSEQIEGMARMALGKSIALKLNIVTDEARAIEQSCVERVEWPDLFHIVVHSLETVNTVLSGLKIYPDTMIWEIVQSRGCYAASTAKDELKRMGRGVGLTADDAYRIVQLAAANVMSRNVMNKNFRRNPPSSFEASQTEWRRMNFDLSHNSRSGLVIQDVIQNGELEVSPELAATEAEVDSWNKKLGTIFIHPENRARWQEIFTFKYLLRNEAKLYKEILGVD